MTEPQRLWLGPPSSEVQLWRAWLDLPDGPLEALARMLSPDERRSADRFHFDVDRRRFLARRGLLRRVLGPVLGTPPARVDLRYGRHGAPEPVAGPGAEEVHWSCSHSSGLALFAVSPSGRVGVDVERLRPIAEAAGVLDRCFSPRERATVRDLPEHHRAAGFFAGWTRKEAVVKAIGVGLGAPLDQVEVALAPGEAPALHHLGGDAAAAARWTIHSFSPAAGFAGALAVERSSRPGARQPSAALGPGAGASRQRMVVARPER